MPLSHYSPSYDDKDEQTRLEWRLSSSDEDESKVRPKRPRSFLVRLLRVVTGKSARRRNSDHAYDFHRVPNGDDQDSFIDTRRRGEVRRCQRFAIPRWLKRTVIGLPIATLMIFGILHVTLVVTGRVNSFWNIEQYQRHLPSWSKAAHGGEGLSRYPPGTTRLVLPIPCHSHNDYWRKVPLFDALHWGCTSVEADVWHFDGYERLYVGHNSASLIRDRTLANLYVDPLVELLDNMNSNADFKNATDQGVFSADPERTLVLLIDFKTNGHDLFSHVHKQLEPLRQRNHLSHWNGDKFVSRAVTVVGTGNTPFDLIVEKSNYRDIFFDAPLDEMWEPLQISDNLSTGDEIKNSFTAPSKPSTRKVSRGQGKTGTDFITSPSAFDTSNSYYASVSFWKIIGYPWTGRLSSKQLNLIRGQIRGAKRRGLKARYWETPSWPTSLRNQIWDVLVSEGADVLNVDDLEAAATLDWNKTLYD